MPRVKVHPGGVAVAAFIVLMGAALAAAASLRGPLEVGPLLGGAAFAVIGAGLYGFLWLDIRDRWTRSSHSFLRLDLGNATIGEVAAAVDRALSVAFPELRCEVPAGLMEGLWGQADGKAKLQLLYGSPAGGPSLDLEAMRGAAAVAAIKGVVERALFEGRDLNSQEEEAVLKEAGGRVSAAPDLKEPLAYRAIFVPRLLFFGALFVLFALGAVAVFVRAILIPLAGAGPWGSPNDLFVLGAALVVAFIMWQALRGAGRHPKGSKRAWPPPGALTVEGGPGVAATEYRIHQGEPDFAHAAVQRRVGREPWRIVPEEEARRELSAGGPVGKWLRETWRIREPTLAKMYAGKLELMDIDVLRDQIARRAKLDESLQEWRDLRTKAPERR